jgi:hypothetical protein
MTYIWRVSRKSTHEGVNNHYIIIQMHSKENKPQCPSIYYISANIAIGRKRNVIVKHFNKIVSTQHYYFRFKFIVVDMST